MGCCAAHDTCGALYLPWNLPPVEVEVIVTFVFGPSLRSMHAVRRVNLPSRASLQRQRQTMHQKNPPALARDDLFLSKERTNSR
jgi:hypothetical protein